MTERNAFHPIFLLQKLNKNMEVSHLSTCKNYKKLRK